MSGFLPIVKGKPVQGDESVIGLGKIGRAHV